MYTFSTTVVPLYKDPSLERQPLNKDHIFLTLTPSITHKPQSLGRPPLYKDQFRWTSAAVFIEGDHCIITYSQTYIFNTCVITPQHLVSCKCC